MEWKELSSILMWVKVKQSELWMFVSANRPGSERMKWNGRAFGIILMNAWRVLELLSCIIRRFKDINLHVQCFLQFCLIRFCDTPILRPRPISISTSPGTVK